MIWIFAFIIFTLIFIRSLRVTAILQQKEYRLDRLLAFLRSKEGSGELWRVIPQLSDFSRTGMKRPVRTLRSGVVFASIWLLVLGWSYLATFITTGSSILVWILFGYVLLPLWGLVAILPGAVLVEVITYYYLWKAKRLLKTHQPIVIGITGSYGKTTTKQIMAQVLSAKSEVFYTQKSFNTRLSASRDIVTRYDGQQICIVEYAAYTLGEIKSLASWVAPDWAVITGFAPQHLALFGTKEKIVEAKSELIKALVNKNQVLYNGRDPETIQIIKKGRAVRPIDFSKSDLVNLSRVKLNAKGQLSFVWKSHEIQTKLVGKHYLDAISGSIIIAQKLKIDDKKIAHQLAKIEVNDRFIQSTTFGQNGLIINDGYSSNPTGFLAAIDLAKELKAKRKAILVTAGITDLGEDSAKIHQQLAQKSAKVFDQVLYLSKTGLEEFQEEFSDKLISDPSVVKEILEHLQDNQLILKEGRLPVWVDVLLKHE